MYDFRQDVKDLIDLTDNTPQSLKQTAKSLMIIGCAFLENRRRNRGNAIYGLISKTQNKKSPHIPLYAR